MALTVGADAPQARHRCSRRRDPRPITDCGGSSSAERQPGNATPIDVPARVSGSTVGATKAADDASFCGQTGGSLWYKLSGAGPGRLVLRLSAGGDLDAFVAVF